MSRIREELDRIRDLPDQELVEALARAREELFRLRLGNYTNQVENTNLLREKRRELARILTVTRARELALESQTSGATRAAATEAETEAAPAKKTRASKKAAEDAPAKTRAPRAKKKSGKE